MFRPLIFPKVKKWKSVFTLAENEYSCVNSRQNGLSEDMIAPEVKMSPDTAVAAVSQLTSGLKSSQPPPGDTTLPAAPVKREPENSPTDSLGKLKKTENTRNVNNFYIKSAS